MRDKHKHIDDLYRDKLGDYSELPPADAWEGLDGRLDSLVPHVPVSPYRWLLHASMATVIAFMGVSVVQKMNKSNSRDTIQTSSQSAQIDLQVNNQDATNDIVRSDVDLQNSPKLLVSGDNIIPNETVQSRQPSIGAQDRINKNHSENSRINNKQFKSNRTNKAVINSKINDLNSGRSVVHINDNILSATSQTKNLVTQSDFELLNSSKQSSVSQINNLSSKDVELTKITKSDIDTKKTNNRVPQLTRLESGLKLGYEDGFNNLAAKKIVVSPYVQLKLSKKIGVMVQPSFKFASVNQRQVGQVQSYHQALEEGTVTKTHSYQTTKVEGSTVTTYINSNFRYTQAYDSIVKVNKTGGKYWEVELPVLMIYQISKNVTMYGGPSVVVSKINGIEEQTIITKGLSRTVDTLVSALRAEPIAPAVADIITYNTPEYSNYSGPVYLTNSETSIRFGATFGFSYEYSSRWNIDALIQKYPSKSNIVSGVNLNSPLSATYFRVSVGYKIIK